jgi:hypothetical protein
VTGRVRQLLTDVEKMLIDSHRLLEEIAYRFSENRGMLTFYEYPRPDVGVCFTQILTGRDRYSERSK